jgi:hypothetical protein
MTVTIELPPAIEADMLAQAEAEVCQSTNICKSCSADRCRQEVAKQAVGGRMDQADRPPFRPHGGSEVLQRIEAGFEVLPSPAFTRRNPASFRSGPSGPHPSILRVARLSGQSSCPRGVNLFGMWRVQRLDQINAFKPANLFDFKSLALKIRIKQIGRFKTVMRPLRSP